MQKQRIWGLPWLCLCLIITCLLFSCAVKRESKATDAKRHWEIKVWLRAGDAGWNIPINDSTLVAPYNVERLTAIIVVISYRVDNMAQVLALEEKLLETGAVENITITSY
ncbi:hypothetical protein [Mucilaginibacter sp.]|uniref:hypothetical protein n=1 Tax=Mucilaginibacter sp. TaxID=1882438 RepID=UPI0026315E73|nr:hypothetical protein [Mucilaginibacter sp.]MDB4925996.1 hypothetical protein [Mucilaginibacter sp.]